jgi:hypothetical protein
MCLIFSFPTFGLMNAFLKITFSPKNTYKILNNRTLKLLVMKQLLNVTLISILLFNFASCKKETEPTPDTTPKTPTPPSISFSQPASSLYNIGDTIPVAAFVEDNEKLISVWVLITNTENNDSLRILYNNLSQKEFNFDTSFVANLPHGSHTNFTIEAVATDVDMSRDTAYKFVHVMNK